jgi:hypothetical protein
MAFTFADSFQQYTVGAASATGGCGTVYSSNRTINIDATGGRWGGKNLSVSDGGGNYIYALAYTTNPAATAGTLNFAVYQSGTQTNTPIASVHGPGGKQLSIAYNASGQITVRRGGSDATSTDGTLIATTARANLWDTNYHFFELLFEIHATAGKVQLYRDGELLLDLTGLNTLGLVAGTWESFTFACSPFTTRRFSDLFTTDTFVRVGERKFETLVITANGASQDLTPNTGAAWDAINDTSPDDDATYIASGTVGHRSTFVLSDMASAPLTIDLVCVRAYSKKDDAATRAIKLGLFDGTNSSLGAEKFVSTAYAHHSALFQTAPDGGAWSKAKVDALLPLVEVTT